MTKEDIVRMAREAGFVIDEASRQYQPKCISFTHYLIDDELSRFASLVTEKATEKANARANKSWSLMCEKMVAAEREACAEVCDELSDAYQKKNPTSSSEPLMRSCWNNAAAAIRARGETTSREQV